MLKDLKKSHTNLYALYVSLLLAFWFNGIARLLNYFFPDANIIVAIILMVLPLAIFLWDDGTLDELQKIEEDVGAVPEEPSLIANVSTQQANQQQIVRNIRTI